MQTKVERIHSSAMAILEKVGIKVHHRQICTLLQKNGIRNAIGARRRANLDDYVRFVHLVQQSEGFRINGGILVQPAELPGDQTHAAMTYATLLFSDKCLMGQPGPAEAVEKIMTLAAMVFGGRQALMQKPRVLTLVNTLSPLQIDRMAPELQAGLETYLTANGLDAVHLDRIKAAAATPTPLWNP